MASKKQGDPVDDFLASVKSRFDKGRSTRNLSLFQITEGIESRLKDARALALHHHGSTQPNPAIGEKLQEIALLCAHAPYTLNLEFDANGDDVRRFKAKRVPPKAKTKR